MFNKLFGLFSKKVQKNHVVIQIKDMGKDISIWNKGYLLTPNTEYVIEDIVDRVATVRILSEISKKDLRVTKSYLPYYGKKEMVHQRWGYKKYRVQKERK